MVRSARLMHMPRVRDAVAERVLPALGLARRGFEIRIPDSGVSSLIYIVDVEGGGGFALRVGRNAKKYFDLRKRPGVIAFWTSRGLPTPRIVFRDSVRKRRYVAGFDLIDTEVTRPTTVESRGTRHAELDLEVRQIILNDFQV